MRLLLLLPTSPWPIYTGGRVRTYHVLRRLAQRHEIVVAGFWRDQEERAGLEQLAGQMPVDVIAVPYVGLRSGRSGPEALARRFWGRVRGLPADVAIWEQPAMHRALNRVLAHKHIDLIQVEFPYLTPYALAQAHIPRLLVTYDIFSVALARRAALATSPLARFRLQRQAQAWQRYERKIYPRYGAVGVMSEPDAAIARRRAPNANVVILPNGVDTAALTPGEIRPLARRLLFVGSPTHAPNIDAACWFLSEIWPELRRKRPHLNLTLVNLDHPQVHACAGPGVEITARLPDLTPQYRRSDVAIVPLRAGSGTRLKILEAFALGLPVVSTPLGHEGLQVEPGRHLLSAGSAAAFSAAVLRLLADVELRRRLATAARILVEQHYDWETIVERHEQVHQTLIAHPPI